MKEAEQIRKAVAAIQRGDKRTAQRILARVLHFHPQHEEAWFWLAAAVDELNRRRECLERVLEINPDNRDAQWVLLELDRGLGIAAPPRVSGTPQADVPPPPTGISGWWAHSGDRWLKRAVVVMAIIAVVWLLYEGWRLLWQAGPEGAVDLRNNHAVIQRWFAGEPVYSQVDVATYPPATYLFLWPFLGWLDLTSARWLWAGTAVAALAWLIREVVRASGARSPAERLFVAFLPLSMYATGAALGNGQLITHVLPVLVVGLSLVVRERGGWRTDLLGAALVLLALAKPSLAVPFLWIVLLVPGRVRPAALVAVGYAALTVWATSFQPEGVVPLLRGWLELGSRLAVGAGEANLHIALATLGWGEWLLPASFALLIGFGVWTYRHRRTDLWLLVGVAALVARFWTYHRWYDDLLILLPLVALFRLTKQESAAGSERVAAALLLAAAVVTVLAPGGLYLFPPPWNTAYVTGQVLIWLAVLFFLGWQARRVEPEGT